MNVYPREYQPTRTPPDSGGARAEREHSCFGPIMWPDGYPGRSAIKRAPAGDPRSRCVTIGHPVRPPDIWDRELEKRLTEPTQLATIGRWHRRPRTIAS